MNFDQWVHHHGISAAAVADLRQILSSPTVIQPLSFGQMTEAAVQQRIRLNYPGILWRNNVGVAQTEQGRPVRYGLCNDSAKVNAEVKSSDLIGITPVVITPHHVGHTVGVFTAIECKREGWTPGEDRKREAAQTKYHRIVESFGGIAHFESNPRRYGNES